jgi:hypothetical protein
VALRAPTSDHVWRLIRRAVAKTSILRTRPYGQVPVESQRDPWTWFPRVNLLDSPTAQRARTWPVRFPEVIPPVSKIGQLFLQQKRKDSPWAGKEPLVSSTPSSAILWPCCGSEPGTASLWSGHSVGGFLIRKERHGGGLPISYHVENLKKYLFCLSMQFFNACTCDVH